MSAQYQRHWKVHFAKKTRGAWRSVKYLGRYLKRPPVAASQLRHYRDGSVVHQYYDHRTQQHKRQKISQEEMLAESGVNVDQSTIYRWVQRYAPEIEKRQRWYWRNPP